MADTVVSADLVVTQWADDEFYSYVRANPLKGLMGSDENSIIQVKEDLTKEAGDSIWFALVNRLTGAATVDDDELHNNEERLGNSGCQVFVNQARHGVVVGQFEKIKTKIDLLKAARVMLRLWNMEQLRDLFLARMFTPVIDGITTYAAATEVQKDAWLAANNPAVANQRILFGSAKANYSGDHSVDLVTIDPINDDFHQDIVRLLKRMAQSCDPLIRPVVTEAEGAGKDRFVVLCGSLAFRDLEANFETVEASVVARGEDARIFSGGDLKIGNVIVKEIPEMDRTPAAGGCWLADVGNAGTTDVEPVFFLGAQALCMAWAAHMSVNTDQWDYGQKRGVAVSEVRGCKKAVFSSTSRDHGMARGYVSAMGD